MIPGEARPRFLSVPGEELPQLFFGAAMWPVIWTAVRAYAPYITFPVAFVVGAVGYHLEWFIRGKEPQPAEEEKSISERREDRKLEELLGKDLTQVVSLKEKLEFAPKAVLNRNRPEKS
ncbi:small integral membrane protein 12 isoform X1 [Ornithorhynchus anatinus]|nr:small integral membrane protein 12 isoform X1 [Ornithorhynchus anatinus]